MKNEKPLDVILADDHVLLRDALASLVASFDGCRVLGTAGNGMEVLTMLSQGQRPDILLLDLNMPKMDGYETARILYQQYPDIKILVLTMYDSEIALIRLLKVGVRGFLKKDIHPTELNRALVSVADDGYYYSHATTGKLGTLFKNHQDNHNAIDRAILNDTEISFLRLASTDFTYKEIALQLKMTPRAIDGLRDVLFEKLQVKSRVGLAIYAVKNGIVNII